MYTYKRKVGGWGCGSGGRRGCHHCSNIRRDLYQDLYLLSFLKMYTLYISRVIITNQTHVNNLHSLKGEIIGLANEIIARKSVGQGTQKTRPLIDLLPPADKLPVTLR